MDVTAAALRALQPARVRRHKCPRKRRPRHGTPLRLNFSTAKSSRLLLYIYVYINKISKDKHIYKKKLQVAPVHIYHHAPYLHKYISPCILPAHTTCISPCSNTHTLTLSLSHTHSRTSTAHQPVHIYHHASCTKSSGPRLEEGTY